MRELSAILIGGPEELTGDDRVVRLTTLVERIWCRLGNGYECFEFFGERMAFDPDFVVYEWSHREYDRAA